MKWKWNTLYACLYLHPKFRQNRSKNGLVRAIYSKTGHHGISIFTHFNRLRVIFELGWVLFLPSFFVSYIHLRPTVPWDLKIVCILKVLSTTNTYFHFIFKEGHWIWENSGAPFSYTYWNSGEPSGGNENCLAYWSSTKGWNDASCDYDTAYKPLCQIIAWK